MPRSGTSGGKQCARGCGTGKQTKKPSHSHLLTHSQHRRCKQCIKRGDPCGEGSHSACAECHIRKVKCIFPGAQGSTVTSGSSLVVELKQSSKPKSSKTTKKPEIQKCPQSTSQGQKKHANKVIDLTEGSKKESKRPRFSALVNEGKFSVQYNFHNLLTMILLQQRQVLRQQFLCLLRHPRCQERPSWSSKLLSSRGNSRRCERGWKGWRR
jgi:hypothetical protein